MNTNFRQKKGEGSKCFRFKSTEIKIWNATVAYNYYPVCYEASCFKDPTTQDLTIEVTIGDQKMNCTQQLEEISDIGTIAGDSIICPARFDVFCGRAATCHKGFFLNSATDEC